MTNDAQGDRQLRQLTVVVEESDDAIFTATLDGIIRSWNPGAERLYGYPASTMIGHPVTILEPPERAGEVVSLLHRLRGGDCIHRYETIRLASDGRRVRVSLTISPLKDTDGSVWGGVTIAHDVSERTARAEQAEQAERALREAEAFNRGLVEAFPDALATITPTGAIVDVNRQMEALAGMPREELIGTAFSDLFCDPDTTRRGVREVLAEGHVSDRELAVRRRCGALVPVSYHATTYTDAAGNLRGVFATARDVTERQRSERALTESEARFRSVVQALGEGILVQRADGEVIECNEAIERIMGYPREQIVGRTWDDRHVTVLNEDGSPMPQEMLPSLRTLRTGQPSRGVILGVDMRDHGLRWMMCNAEPLQLPGEDHPSAVVTSFADITDLRSTQESLRTTEERALHDELTGLPNRALLLNHLESALNRARRHGSIVALLFLDLDDFKAVNDSLGHLAGDEFLVHVGQRLVNSLRVSDTAARIGGDEFVVVCEDLDDPGEAGRLAERIQQVLAMEIPLRGRPVSAPASIGVALSRPDSTPETLLRDADAAMYVAKRGGGRRWEPADAGLQAEALRVLSVAGELHRALTQHELVVHYQPIIDLETGSTASVEALLRWRHPERGLLLPGEFLDVAEQRGLITDVGSWVLTTACTEAAGWARRHGPAAPVVTVNVSSRQLGNQGLTRLVMNTLDSAGLTVDRLRLEIPETQLVTAGVSAIADLHALSAAGVRIAVDDFGTGFAGFNYLRRLPVDELKIDRSFTDGLGTDPTDTAITSSIIALGRSLGLTIVAEGIQTTQQRDIVTDLGCDYGQGWLWHHAVAGEQIDLLLARTRAEAGEGTEP
jgi:diguanylate cyclase (GGDEF)-like protein/PAS domain S-box-containing protein